ncbi:MAG: ROK family protein [Clostridiales bacterium]|nr:ROK family protein [Clostridiales bacterium]
MSEKTALALDIGGSKYIVGLVTRGGEIVDSVRGTWRELTADCVMESLIGASRQLLDKTGARPDVCGATIPGLADSKAGVWVEASFSGIRDVPVCEILRAAMGIPAYCENDGQAYALAEIMFGMCAEVDDFLYINVSNGIGGAIVSGGRLVAGARGMAAEFGHCVAVESGRPCKCGTRGCLEMHAAGPGIAQNYAELGGAPMPDGTLPDAKEIARRARNGESAALETFRLEGEYLGRMVAIACNLMNPSAVVLGGGVSLAFDLFGEALKAAAEARMYRSANPNVKIMPTRLGYMAGLFGAAAVGFAGLEG